MTWLVLAQSRVKNISTREGALWYSRHLSIIDLDLEGDRQRLIPFGLGHVWVLKKLDHDSL